MRLPQELLDRIIDFLYDDVAALRSSCLVHTRWIPPCRNHLFASVTFHELFDLEVWADSFPSVPHSPAKYVRNLSIAGLWASLGDEKFNPDELEEPLLAQFRSFENVRKLVFTAINLHPSSSPETFFSHVQSSLTSLEFYSPFPTTPAELLHFVCSFPHLEDLTVTGPNIWLEEREKRYIGLQKSPPLGGKLMLVGFSDPGGAFITRLVDLPDSVSFRSIELDFIGMEDYQPVGRLIKACASTLELLQLGSSFSGMLSYLFRRSNFFNKFLEEAPISTRRSSI